MKNSITSKITITKNDLLLIIAAFVSYTGMYAVRKSFLAAQFHGEVLYGYDYKTVLVLSQVVGYMFSKFIGIKFVSESKGRRNERLLLGLVSFGLFCLLLIAVLPHVLRPIAMFFNGLCLGMIFGLVLSYLEGRRHTELLVAGLSTTFIFSTGFIKSIGVWLVHSMNVGEMWIPFITGLLFFPFFVVAVLVLKNTKQPDAMDIQLRTKRIPMDRSQRKDFLRNHGLLFFGLVLIYVLITASRDFRDNFTVEFWSEMGYSDQPQLITITEIPIAILVLGVSAMAVLISRNKTAFLGSLMAVVLGAILLWGSTVLMVSGTLLPIYWMMVSGLGIYLPYILFHCVIFERLLALLRYKGTIGFLFYVADALGYLVSVLILLGKELFQYKGSWLNFFLQLNAYTGLGMMILAVVILWKTYNIKEGKSALGTLTI
ncbi:DUF5690 family protein [Maribacter litoralis]|uniref:DUF5690 family protein n=1 Tax=Maribacter litoralis TaxID=2059726 RepID=UPI003F5CF889